MTLRDGVFNTEHYNGFTLDIDSIQADSPSLSADRVQLAYNGRLPAQFEGCENARVCLNVKPNDVRVCLRANKSKDKLLAIIDAEPLEIADLLDRFFEAPSSGSTGLESFWSGVWYAHYYDWRKAHKGGLLI